MHNDEEEDNGPRMTDKFFKTLLRSDWKLYYSTPALNDHLYLHFKGFQKIENLDAFTGLKVLYLESNGLNKIEGLDHQPELKSLFLHENLIQKIENLSLCTQIVTLNLSDNLIKKIENLEANQCLQNLNLAKNKIGKNDLEDVIGLLEIPTLSTIDLSNNLIADPQIIEEVLKKLPKLGVLYLQGNEVCKKIPNYRKSLICSLPELKYLDDRPVFPEDRRYAEAFMRGGLPEERKERKLKKQEDEEYAQQNRIAFDNMIKRAREEKKLEDQRQKEKELKEIEEKQAQEKLELEKEVVEKKVEEEEKTEEIAEKEDSEIKERKEEVNSDEKEKTGEPETEIKAEEEEAKKVEGSGEKEIEISEEKKCMDEETPIEKKEEEEKLGEKEEEVGKQRETETESKEEQTTNEIVEEKEKEEEIEEIEENEVPELETVEKKDEVFITESTYDPLTESQIILHIDDQPQNTPATKENQLDLEDVD